MRIFALLILISLSLILNSNIYGQVEEGKEFDQMPLHIDCKDVKDEKEKAQCSNNKLINLIIENLKYPKSAKDSKTEGTVVASFVVNTDGSMEDMKIVKGLSDDCDAEVLRVMEVLNSGKFQWHPGRKDNKAVNVEMKLPVQFRLPKK